MASQNVTNQYNSYYGPAGQYSPVSASGAGGGSPYNTGYATAGGPNYFQGYQSGNGYTPTGTTLLASPTQQQQKQPLNDQTALARLQGLSGQLDSESTGETDGVIAAGDLQKALDDTSDKYSKEDKEVIKYALDNQNGLRGRLDQFDGNGDGSFKVDTINKVVANPNAQGEKPLDQKLTNTEAFRNLKDHMESKFQGKISREELSRLKDDQSVSPELRASAKKILENEALFKTADTGGDDENYDGTIGIKDLGHALKQSDLDKVGGGSTASASSTSGQPVVQNTYPPVSTGNPNQDYYTNTIYNRALGPATQIYRQAQAAPAA